ncbi:aspartate oxidase [Acetobacter nitrogenifigens DSM 23921 = NBRC 105050]|uniref:L-aspartate oxidase n=1 Tax=Acetobacter nitrogenifigens DSM 23921 = NBRC 105050 TaxID=1120919 RepID=A0A511X6E4_9PROT|nr:FAD-binding protein [Acetobacter nitrogenifigens]GBQ94455.1 aspartate oxidase [Acetobacter nitrogenifigens DSM 23921 = NBRC 105050]GEN58527.1 L-aspartate oxidase [Acetobacter nitrogenifigens DSM 23921 = NBRC 105050]
MMRSLDTHALRGQPVIVGAGVAGLLTALRLGDMPCVIVSAAEKPGAGVLASGVGKALGRDEAIADRAAKTLACGAGLASPEVVQQITDAMPHVSEDLARIGVGLDAHDSGAALHAALLAKVHERQNVTIVAPAMLRRLTIIDGHVRGVSLDVGERLLAIDTNIVILASGGACGLFPGALTQGPEIGAGMAVAARAGVEFSDLELIYFHPLTLDEGDARSTGVYAPVEFCKYGVLFDDAGCKLNVEQRDPGSLARDIAVRRAQGRAVFFDITRALTADAFKRDPALNAMVQQCRARGLDPKTQALPVRPAAAFQIGGIKVDVAGRSSIPGLWACGEVACTGFHGASISAGNPLLEAVVCSGFVAESVLGASLSPLCDVSGVRPDRAPLHRQLSMVRQAFGNALGPVRNRAGVLRELDTLSRCSGYDDAALMGCLTMISALMRQESRGVHYRSDFQQRDAVARHSVLTESDMRSVVRTIGRNHFGPTSADAQMLDGVLARDVDFASRL